MANIRFKTVNNISSAVFKYSSVFWPAAASDHTVRQKDRGAKINVQKPLYLSGPPFLETKDKMMFSFESVLQSSNDAYTSIAKCVYSRTTILTGSRTGAVPS